MAKKATAKKEETPGVQIIHADDSKRVIAGSLEAIKSEPWEGGKIIDFRGVHFFKTEEKQDWEPIQPTNQKEIDIFNIRVRDAHKKIDADANGRVERNVRGDSDKEANDLIIADAQVRRERATQELSKNTPKPIFDKQLNSVIPPLRMTNELPKRGNRVGPSGLSEADKKKFGVVLTDEQMDKGWNIYSPATYGLTPRLI